MFNLLKKNKKKVENNDDDCNDFLKNALIESKKLRISRKVEVFSSCPADNISIGINHQPENKANMVFKSNVCFEVEGNYKNYGNNCIKENIYISDAVNWESPIIIDEYDENNDEKGFDTQNREDFICFERPYIPIEKQCSPPIHFDCNYKDRFEVSDSVSIEWNYPTEKKIYTGHFITIREDPLLFDSGNLSSDDDFIKESVGKEKVIKISSPSMSTSEEPSDFYSNSKPSVEFYGYKLSSSIHSIRANERTRIRRAKSLTISSPEMVRVSDRTSLSPNTKPLTNCCTVCAFGGIYKPLYFDFGKEEPPKIKWVTFQGYHQSPFDDPPPSIADYSYRLKKKVSLKSFDTDAVSVNFCEICGIKFGDPVQHRNSKHHIHMTGIADWKGVDELFSEISKDFVL